MDVKNKKVVIVGSGDTAVALARLLLREGAKPVVTDMADGPKQQASRATLDELGVPCELGGHTDAAFRNAALVIPSPGVSPTISPILAAQAQGADVLGEMEFAFSRCRSRLLAVTGTNGKTTTTQLLRNLVGACGRSVLLAGNNDFPFSAAVMADPAPDFIVLEVSSYQLETARTFRPWIAAVLNITPDHLGRHGDLENYAAVKAKIFAHQAHGDTAVINHDDGFLRHAIIRMGGLNPGIHVCPFSLKTRLENGLWLDDPTIRFGNEIVATVADTALPGRHNLQNVLCALAMMRAGGFNWEHVINGLRAFLGVEHRIEFVARIQDIDFYNDSKSTNIDSLRVALESFSKPIILIAGGRGKGSDYAVLRGLVHKRVRTMITLGEDAPLLEAAFGGVTAVERATDMADAVQRAARSASPGEIVLLSPACASFDMYDNFEHRGRVFKQCVRDLDTSSRPSQEEGSS